VRINRDLLHYVGIFSYIGFAIAVPIIGGTLLGYYLDGKLKTGHVFTFVLLGLGLVDGFYNMIRIAMKGADMNKKR